METAVTVVLWIAGAILLYLAIGHLLHRVVFPESDVELSSYFKAVDVFASDMEKLRQVVLRQQSGRVYCRIELEPRRFLDEDERNTRPPRILLQPALISPHLESLITEGPPPAVQRAQCFFLAPAPRALGYRSFYEKYRI